MAANFNSGDKCQGANCQSITDMTYYVKEKKRLCDDCASKEGCIGKARKGGPNLYCMDHDEEMKIYCKTHGVPICHLCGMIDHQQPCVRQKIEGAIKELSERLADLKEQIQDRFAISRIYGDEINMCRKDTDTHLQVLKDEIDALIDEAIKTDKDREEKDVEKIEQENNEKNRKIKEEIQRLNAKIQQNNEEKDERLKQNLEIAERRRKSMENKQHVLHRDIKNIAEEKERKIAELEKSLHDDMKTIEQAMQTLDSVLGDDKKIAEEGHRLNTSVSDKLKKPLNEDGVKQITDRISGVRFVKGVGRKKYDGRVDGYDGEWKLIDTINVSNKIKCPVIVGCIDENNVIITGGLAASAHTYMLDMNTKHIQRVITGSDTSCVTSCALLNDDKIVCGKRCAGCTGDSLTECISVYDRQWVHINDVTIPQNTKRDITRVAVAVDQDGMIIAAEGAQSKIYVINPADGRIVNTITCEQDIRICGVLSSGHIIAQPTFRRVLIIDRQGGQREIRRSDVILNVYIDPLTDDLYAVTSDDEYKTCMIDQVMSGSDMKKRRVASFPLSNTFLNSKYHRRLHLVSSRLMMTPSGKIIACDGKNILMFENRLTI